MKQMLGLCPSSQVLTKRREHLGNHMRNKLAGLRGTVNFSWLLQIRREERLDPKILSFSTAPKMMSCYLENFPSFYRTWVKSPFKELTRMQ